MNDASFVKNETINVREKVCRRLFLSCIDLSFFCRNRSVREAKNSFAFVDDFEITDRLCLFDVKSIDEKLRMIKKKFDNHEFDDIER